MDDIAFQLETNFAIHINYSFVAEDPSDGVVRGDESPCTETVRERLEEDNMFRIEGSCLVDRHFLAVAFGYLYKNSDSSRTVAQKRATVVAPINLNLQGAFGPGPWGVLLRSPSLLVCLNLQYLILSVFV